MFYINQFNKNIPSETDNLLAKIILMHPFMEEAMDIQIEISWFNNGILYSIKCSICITQMTQKNLKNISQHLFNGGNLNG